MNMRTIRIGSGAGYAGDRLEPSEVRIRVAGRARTREDADIIGNEVEALYTNGPAGGGGAVKRTRDIISVASVLVSRYDVKPEVQIFEV